MNEQQSLFDIGPDAPIPAAEVPVVQPVHASAVLSSCGTYRYRLARWWDLGAYRPAVGFIMVNPSEADHQVDDPTLRQCMAFARKWGYSRVEIVNLFALRSPDPMALRKAPDPVGPDNDAHLDAFLQEVHAGKVSQVILAWGNHGKLHGRDRAVLDKLQQHNVPLLCLRISKKGQPEHPLYKPLSLRPIPYTRTVPSSPARK